MAFTPIQTITPFPLWTHYTPTLPSLYWDVDSHEERIKRLCLELHKLVEYATYLGENINLDHELIEELQDEFQKFIDGGYDEYYKDLIYKWIQDNMEDLISAGIKQVFFGLTDDGYFCAYVPDSWSEITFDTGSVFGRSDYGRLILRFEADPAMGVIDNTYGSSSSFGNAQLVTAAKKLADAIDQLVTDVEINARRTDEVFAAEFTNLDEVVGNGNF